MCNSWVLAAADFQGIGVRRIFPCWDRPNIRANFSISVKHYQNYTPLSNIGILDKSMANMGIYWTNFQTTVKIPPYQVAIVLANLNRVSETNIWCRQHVQPQIKFAQTMAKKAILHLKHIYDDIHPLNLSHVIIPDFRDEGVESWGIALYRESRILYDENLDSIAKKFEVAFMVGRKVAHQYICNLISQSSWSYLWMNEGIATFLAMRFVDKFVRPHLMDLLTVQLQQESFRWNDYYNMPLVQEVDTLSDTSSLFSFTYYLTAPIFIRSLFYALSEGILDISINDYLNEHQFSFIESLESSIDKFFNLIQKKANSIAPESNTNVTKFISWITQNGYPVLQVEQQFNDVIKIYMNESYQTKMSIRVTYITQHKPDTIEEEWLEPHKPILYLDNIYESNWVIVNVQQTGYYRVNYDNDNWQKFVKYLNSTEYSNIHVLNRAQIIDDAYYFLSRNQLNFSLFKRLTSYLSQETDYVAWYPVLKILEQISNFFPFPESSEVKEHFQKILDSILEKVGFRLILDEDNFIDCLRHEVAKWACTLNSQQCKFMSWSITNLMSITEDGQLEMDPYFVVPPGWKEWVYCRGMTLMHNVNRNKIFNAQVLDIKLLQLWTCTEDYIVIIGYLDRLMSGYFTDVRHHIAMFHFIIAKHVKNDIVFNYISENLERVIPREIDMTVGVVDIVNHLYSIDQIQKLKDVLKAKVDIYMEMYMYFEEKMDTRCFEILSHSKYFENFLKT